MARDIHKKPFDEGTKAKLLVFQDYLKEWLPVFLSKKDIYWKNINIYDFFAGPGYDSKGEKGTPIIIKDELIPYFEDIISKNLNVNLYLNEYNKNKKLELENHFKENDDLRPYSVTIESEDFKDAFDRQFPNMCKKDCANLLFLDQNGIKHISEDIFKKITELKTTDFLFFISSSTIKRFCEQPNIAQYIKIKPEEVDKTPYHRIHRLVLDYYKSLIPSEKQYYLASFSLKKNAGIYGLIFGSGHVLGIEKFLTTCWSIDPERGEANFDIDDDNIVNGQINLFSGNIQKPKKLELFERELESKILSGELKNDREIYIFALTNSFTPKHIRSVINKLISDKKIKPCKLNLTSKICKSNSPLTEVKIV